MIKKVAVNWEQERICKNDNNEGLIYGIYYYDIPDEFFDTEDAYNSDIVEVEWYKTEEERDLLMKEI